MYVMAFERSNIFKARRSLRPRRKIAAPTTNVQKLAAQVPGFFPRHRFFQNVNQMIVEKRQNGHPRGACGRASRFPCMTGPFPVIE